MKGRITCHTVIENWMIPPAACHYWQLNDPFCCVHCSRDSQCFSMGWTTPQKLSFPMEDLDLHLLYGWKRYLNWFSRFCRAHPCGHHIDGQTHRPTTLPATFLAMGHSICTTCIICALIIMIMISNDNDNDSDKCFDGLMWCWCKCDQSWRVK